MKIKMTLDSLWHAYAGRAQSGRVECPVSIADFGDERVATHIYRGYGSIRLERIEGAPEAGKGFQGEAVVQGTPWMVIEVCD